MPLLTWSQWVKIRETAAWKGIVPPRHGRREGQHRRTALRPMPERCSSVGPSKVPFGRSRGRQIILRPARRRGKPLDAMPPGSKRRRESRMEPKRKRIEKVPDRRRLTSAPWSAALGIVAGAGGQSPLLVFGGPETRPHLLGVPLRFRQGRWTFGRQRPCYRANRTGRNALDVRPGCVIDVAGAVNPSYA
jgi:hypothetical protein